LYALTRTITFAAAHRYRRPDWSEEQNARAFGLCARPHYHGHTYKCDVTVSGTFDPETGFIVDLALLDRILGEEVKDRFEHRNINLEIPEFADGGMIPTGENIARYIAELVQARLGDEGRVINVTVAEDDTLRVSYSPA
jgi:6-pyruvoyltetrahydropterin/6-carboxytetrahydropterin synthase